jgi:hypothetical protein
VTQETPTRLLRALNTIERVGNKLPDPVSLFIISILTVMVLSAVLAAMGASGVNPASGETVTAISLLDSAQIRRLLMEMPQILTSFPPLGIVLVVIIGSGLAERSGFFAAALKGLVRAVPRPLDDIHDRLRRRAGQYRLRRGLCRADSRWRPSCLRPAAVIPSPDFLRRLPASPAALRRTSRSRRVTASFQA